MKQVAQNYKSGDLDLLDVPVPQCRPGGVLVRTEFSLISAGTEAMKVRESKMSLVAKAKARPDQVKKVLDSVSQQGLSSTYRKVMNRLDSYTPLGYSLAGVVEEVGAGVNDLKVGQRVACAGDAYALHAEYNWVPRNLCVLVPDSVEPLHAAFTTVGSIAMQGYRQSEGQLGETAVVIGLGLVGQLLTQILVAAGIRVMGLDVSEDRCRLGEASGATLCALPDAHSLDEFEGALLGATSGAGADHVFLATGTTSRDPVLTAARLARDRARIIDIGKTNLDLPWNSYYEKELDVRFSRSYGPGRYDPKYEEGGVDYPVGYVRWTENRNMDSFIQLMAEKRIDVGKLVDHVADFEDAVATYEQLNGGELTGIGILFRYAAESEASRSIAAVPALRPAATGSRIALGVIGCGNYATTMLMPHLSDRDDVQLSNVATARALSAATAQQRFGFDTMTTDVAEILEDEALDAVLIATRHDSHADLVCAALEAGKAVFVEKPLALSIDELRRVIAVVEKTGNDRLMVGFNRRFAPLLTGLKREWGQRREPLIVEYTVNAGPLDDGSWYADPRKYGSRFVGEGGHFLDTVSWWLDSVPVDVAAASTPNMPDNMACQLTYEDGSVAMVTYTTTADRRYPKEVFSAFGEGKVAKIHNFGSTELWSGRKKKQKRSLKGVDKGQSGQMDAFVSAVRDGSDMPIAFPSLVATTAATLAADQSISSGRRESIAEILATADLSD